MLTNIKKKNSNNDISSVDDNESWPKTPKAVEKGTQLSNQKRRKKLYHKIILKPSEACSSVASFSSSSTYSSVS